MSESPEHQFLSQCVTDVLSEFAQTNLYAYLEAERRKFDFACELIRDWSRPLVGQTLWRHTEGVDKDVRTMLLDPDAEICAYVARDTIKGRRLFSEVIKDFRSSGAALSPHRLRVFWVPQDFDADDEAQREFIRDFLFDSVTRDLLMNVVFGKLTAEDMRFVARVSGEAGLHLAILHMLSTSPEPDLRNKEISTRFGVSSGPVRERILRLLGCGFLGQFGGGVISAHVTLKGRVFLDLCCELNRQTARGEIGPEMLQILRLLEMHYDPTVTKSASQSLHLAGPALTEVPEMVTGRILASIHAASDRWGIQFDNIDHVIWNGTEGFNVNNREELTEWHRKLRSSGQQAIW